MVEKCKCCGQKLPEFRVVPNLTFLRVTRSGDVQSNLQMGRKPAPGLPAKWHGVTIRPPDGYFRKEPWILVGRKGEQKGYVVRKLVEAAWRAEEDEFEI